MIKIVKEHLWFHYLLIETQQYMLILLELNKIRDKSITHNIFGIQDNESIMCEFYCIVFIEYMRAGKTLLDCTNLFPLNDCKKNEPGI